MKTEDFDKKLREKLLELNTEANEEEVNKVHDFVRSGKKKNWKKYGLFYLFGFLLIVSAGTIAISVSQWHTIKSLAATNTELVQQMKEIKTSGTNRKPRIAQYKGTPDTRIHDYQPAGNAADRPHSESGAQPATYQKKEIPSAAAHAVVQNDAPTPADENDIKTPAAKHKALLTGNASTQPEASIIPSPDDSGSGIASAPNPGHEGVVAGTLPAASGTSAISSLLSDHTAFPNAPAIALKASPNNTMPARAPSEIHPAAPVDSPPAHTELPGDSSIASDKSAPSLTLLDEDQNRGKSIMQGDSGRTRIAGGSAVLADTSLMVKDGRTKPVIRSFKYRVGLNGEVASMQLAAGVMGEVLFNEHWSVSAGFKYVVFDHETFADEDDYHKRKGKDFKHEHNGTSADTAQISNIHQSYRLFQVPLSFNYTFPLKKGFALLFSLGTDIDVYGQKDVDYNARIRNVSDATHQNSLSMIPVVAFNNIVTALAVEKQWSRFTVQLAPFLSPQLKKTDYKNANLYYGLRLRLLYTFR